MNDFVFAIMSGINIVIGASMFVLLTSKVTEKWSGTSRAGFAIMGAGLIGQAIYVILGYNLTDPISDQLWLLKDIGMAIFVIPMISRWAEHLTK